LSKINTSTAALLGVAVGVRTVEALVAKKVLTHDEAIGLFCNALQSIRDPDENAEARRLLRSIMPGLDELS
jgi:hypothetical protein